METTYEIIEDNGGGLWLYIFDKNGDVIGGIGSLEFANKGEFNNVQESLKSDPLAEIAGWDGHMDDPQADYNSTTSYDFGWCIVADSEGVHPDAMGRAAERYFSPS